MSLRRRANRLVLKAAAIRALASAFLFLQLCLPGLQASMTKLAAPPAAHHERPAGAGDAPAPASHASHFKCSICAAASIPASLPPPAADVLSSAAVSTLLGGAAVAPAKTHQASSFSARAPPAA